MHFTFAFKQDKNCPVFIDGVIHNSFYSGAYDDGMHEDWYYAEPGTSLAPLPQSLVLVTKDKPYEFDFRSGFKGHIVSGKFLAIFNTLKTANWEIAELDIVTPKGISISQSKYFFMRQRHSDKTAEDVIDKISSKIEYRKTGEIKHISTLVINSVSDLDIFSINEITLFRRMFLSPAAADAFKTQDMKGFEIVDAHAIGSIKAA